MGVSILRSGEAHDDEPPNLLGSVLDVPRALYENIRQRLRRTLNDAMPPLVDHASPTVKTRVQPPDFTAGVTATARARVNAIGLLANTDRLFCLVVYAAL